MKVFRLSVFLVVLVAASACVSASNGAAPNAVEPSSAANMSVSAAPSPSPVAAGLGNGPGAVGTPALPPATVNISPAQVQAGALSFSLAIEPARHMLDQAAATTSDPDPAHQANSANTSASASNAYVLQGMLQLTNNFNPAQPIPDDMPQAMLRHVNVQVRDATGGASVPYLSASMDMLLDGHPAMANVPLVPMIDGGSASAQLYYGNNVKLTQRGNYQVFVRIQPNALLGKDALPAAQFNVAVQ